MTDPNATVIPGTYSVDGHSGTMGGLTKREYFAFELAKIFIPLNYSDTPLTDAVKAADLLIEKLNNDAKVNKP